MRPDFFLVLPWHFKSGILEREREFLLGGGRMIFPFPEIEIVWSGAAGLLAGGGGAAVRGWRQRSSARGLADGVNPHESDLVERADRGARKRQGASSATRMTRRPRASGRHALTAREPPEDVPLQQLPYAGRPERLRAGA